MILPIIFILFLGLVFRILYWLYSAQGITLEAAIWGFMARQVLDAKHCQMWRYGADSIGALFSYLTALIMPVFNRLSMFYVELTFSILFMLVIYLVGYRLFNKKIGLVSAILVALAPSSLIKSSVSPNGVYNIILLCGCLLFLLAVKIVEGENNFRNYIFFSVTGIISFWTHIYSICFIIPCLFFIMIKSRFRTKLICFISIILMTPHILNNVIFRNLEEILVYYAKDILFLQLNNILGIELGIVYLFSFIYLCYRLSKKPTYSPDFLMLIFIIFSVPVITRVKVASSLDIHPAVILYAVFPFITARLFLDIKNKHIFSIVVSLIIIFQVGDTIFSAIKEREENNILNSEMNRMISELKGHNIHYVYTDEKLVPYISFLTNGEITAGNYKEYNFIVDASEKIAVMLPTSEGITFEKVLRYVSKDYKKVFIGQYMFFYSFAQSHIRRREISPLKWIATSNYNNEEVNLVFDRDAATRWTTHVKKIPGMYFLLDLGEEVVIDKIILYLGKYIQDRAIGLKVQVSDDGTEWQDVVYLEDNTNILFWSGPHIFLKDNADRQEYYFEPVKTRYIRLEQLGYKYKDYNYWSITELFVYSPAGIGDKISYGITNLRSFLGDKGLDNVYSDYWLSLNINRDRDVSRHIDLCSNSAIVVDKNRNIDYILERYNIGYKKDLVDSFFIYYFLNGSNFRSLDKKLWSGSANIQPHLAKNAFDNNLATRWSTERFQSQGYYYEIDLDEEKVISGIRLWHSGSINDWPRGIRVEALGIDAKWRLVEYEKDSSSALYWNGFSIITDSAEYFTYIFKPVKAKGIRCILEESSDKHYWSIHEIDILI